MHVWLVIASFLAGALNAMAGGGSFLSFPALLGVGVLPIQANATNTVALWPGQFTSIAAYWQDLKANVRLVLPVVSAALLGGVVGLLSCSTRGNPRSWLWCRGCCCWRLGFLL
jgi:uncharacterized protein